jgi:hypothetical protein
VAVAVIDVEAERGRRGFHPPRHGDAGSLPPRRPLRHGHGQDRRRRPKNPPFAMPSHRVPPWSVPAGAADLNLLCRQCATRTSRPGCPVERPDEASPPVWHGHAKPAVFAGNGLPHAARLQARRRTIRRMPHGRLRLAVPHGCRRAGGHSARALGASPLGRRAAADAETAQPRRGLSSLKGKYTSEYGEVKRRRRGEKREARGEGRGRETRNPKRETRRKRQTANRKAVSSPSAREAGGGSAANPKPEIRNPNEKTNGKPEKRAVAVVRAATVRERRPCRLLFAVSFGFRVSDFGLRTSRRCRALPWLSSAREAGGRTLLAPASRAHGNDNDTTRAGAATHSHGLRRGQLSGARFAG